ncbi:hypothetical protein TNCV_1923931 [Trichonephila clavipes]|nr:hypothetical protein TNCV_1923931 [Trichonephila clavipes]
MALQPNPRFDNAGHEFVTIITRLQLAPLMIVNVKNHVNIDRYHSGHSRSGNPVLTQTLRMDGTFFWLV